MTKLKEDEQELVEENLFVRLEEAEERRRRRVDTWLDHQTYTCKLPQSFPNPFNLSLLEEAYIYSSQVGTIRTYYLSPHIVPGCATLAENEQTT